MDDELSRPTRHMSPEEKGQLLIAYAQSGKRLVRLEFSGASVSGEVLSGASLRGADVSRGTFAGCTLTEADLRYSDLSGADLSCVSARGVQLSFADLRGADLGDADLTGARMAGVRLWEARMGGTRLDQADLDSADLRRALLSKASLRGAGLPSATLDGAILDGADLRDAQLAKASLERASLDGADLRGANLRGANLRGTSMKATRLDGAHLTDADLANVRFPQAIGSASDLKEAIVDWRTVGRMLGIDRVVDVLVRTGMPEVTATYLVDALRSIDVADLFTMLQSVFLSYGQPDENVAARLRNELTENGVKTWYFPEDAVPGSRLARHLEDEVNRYDRMILCCSVRALQRPGVLHEVEEVLEREQREGGSEVLIPVLLDDIWGSGDQPPEWWPARKRHVYRSLRKRVCVDFRDALDDPEKWSMNLQKLLLALKRAT